MARANRHYIPGYVWHITHRCHKREFLLTGECPAGGVKGHCRKTMSCREVLSQQGQGTSNLSGTDDGGYNGSSRERKVRDGQEREVIPQTIQLIAGRTGQEYNQRKNRKGAFWEDRYHSTAVEAGSHKVQCMVYIGMNMVRAGVVAHPSE